MRPSYDPECQRYIDDPTYTWYGGRWRTQQGVEAARRARARHNRSEKDRAVRARYERSEKGCARRARYKNKKVQICVGGMRFYYRIDPDKKEEIKNLLAAFRQEQSRTRKEMAENGWIN